MYRIIRNNPNAIILDVRSRQEYREGHIQGAINIPTYEIEKKIDKISKDKSATVICYCSAGIRSKKTVKILKMLGYTEAYSVAGGIII